MSQAIQNNANRSVGILKIVCIGTDHTHKIYIPATEPKYFPNRIACLLRSGFDHSALLTAHYITGYLAGMKPYLTRVK